MATLAGLLILGVLAALALFTAGGYSNIVLLIAHLLYRHARETERRHAEFGRKMNARWMREWEASFVPREEEQYLK